jgi:hypothetical protein
MISDLYELHFYSANSLKQQTIDRHVAPLGNILPFLSQALFLLTHKEKHYLGGVMISVLF